ncbi:MAG TPA: hypothetical protein VKV04_14505 [Verrucomicrobiae bacterium]|nr:hypothetical protein [Verrucomicrobiae bacterium]
MRYGADRFVRDFKEHALVILPEKNAKGFLVNFLIWTGDFCGAAQCGFTLKLPADILGVLVSEPAPL